ncbi:MAG: hypothetical protein AB4290_30905, partial [Spirulina sp.]
MIENLKLKDKIEREIEMLDEEQLQEVANFISFLKFSSRLNHQTDFNLAHVANLYQEFAEEDRKLAEEGIDEYAQLLKAEG